MIEALSHEFMQNALAAGLLAALACGLVGALVVVGRMVFLAGGIAHAAYGGIGLAFYTGWPVMPCALGFSLLASGVMASVTWRGQAREDTVIGALWAAGMAMGIILVDLSPGFAGDLMSWLFGSILAVSRQDLLFMAGLDALLLLLVTVFYRDFLAFTFDREYALTRGAPVVLLHFLLPAMAALTVVMLIRVVGLILVMALLTIPPYLAERHSRSLAAMMVRASLYGALFCSLGLLLAWTFDLTSGATIIAVAASAFLLTACVDRLRAFAGRGGRGRA